MYQCNFNTYKSVENMESARANQMFSNAQCLPPGTPVRMRFLGLHGRYQCGFRFAEKLTGIKVPPPGSVSQREINGKVLSFDRTGPYASAKLKTDTDLNLEIVSLDAPFEVEASIHLGSNGSVQRKARVSDSCTSRVWWREQDEEETIAKSMGLVERFVNDNGPFDGLLGFSQGGALANIVTSHHCSMFKLLVIISGYNKRNDKHCPTCNPHVRYVHIYGKNDKMVRPEQSLKMADELPGKVFHHDQGHVVPSIEWLWDTALHSEYKLSKLN